MDSELTTPPTSPEPVLTGPGTRLKTAREAAGMSIEELARRLHLKADLLTALENDDFARLPEPAYVRGYLRAVAKALAIGEAPLLEAYAAISPPEPRIEVTQRLQEPYRETRARKPVYVVGTVLLLVIAGLFAWHFFMELPQDAAVEEPPADAFAPVLPASPTPEPEQPESADASGEASDVPPVIEVAPAPVPSAAPMSALPAGPSAATPGVGRLNIAVRRDSWIEIRDPDDRRLLSDLLRAGTEQTIEGRSPMRVIIGNADGVTMTFNGRPVEIAPYVGRDRVARFTLPSP